MHHQHRILDILEVFAFRQEIECILVVARISDGRFIELLSALVGQTFQFQVDLGRHSRLGIEFHTALRVIDHQETGAGTVFNLETVTAVRSDLDGRPAIRMIDVHNHHVTFRFQAGDLAGEHRRLLAARDGGQ